MISERFFSSIRFFPFDFLGGGLGDFSKKKKNISLRDHEQNKFLHRVIVLYFHQQKSVSAFL